MANDLFNLMADCAPVMLWISRVDSLCFFFNKTWLEFTGRSLEQEWGVGWLENVHFEDFQCCADTYTTNFNLRNSFKLEYRLRRYDGEFRWILDHGVPYYNDDKEFLGFIGSCIDITDSKNLMDIVNKMNAQLEQRVLERTAELKRSELELEVAKLKAEEATNNKSVFVSTVSHELRTPMTVIKSSLDLLISGIKGDIPAGVQSLLEIANRNADRMLRLVNDILDVEKLEAGKYNFIKKPQLLLPLIKQSLASNALYAEKFNANLVLGKVIPDAIANIDADRIIQVLDNLISNAAKFTKPHTDVTVSMQRDTGQICILVKDCGEGISPDFSAKIFSQFAQFQKSSNATIAGTGLGLNIAKTLMEEHQGSIRFETSSEGSTFIMVLPECE